MQYIPQPLYVALELVSPEELAQFIVTAFFTIFNLLVTYFVLKKFLFKPAIKFIKKRQAAIEAEFLNAKEINQAAEAKLRESTARIESSFREASTIVNEAKIQAETQSDAIISSAKKEASEIIARADTDIDRMRIAMIEEMHDNVADLAVNIASRVIKQTIDEKKQKELVDQFISEETKRKEKV